MFRVDATGIPTEAESLAVLFVKLFKHLFASY